MNDRYRLDFPTGTTPEDVSAPPLPPAARSATTALTDTLLWVVAVIAVAANVALSAAGQDLWGIGAGLAVLGTGTALTVRYLQRRK